MILLSRYLIFFILLFCFSSQQTFAENQIVINEFSPHPSSDSKEWVELINPAGLDLTSYWIDDDSSFSDDSGSSGKKRLENIQTGTASYHQFFEFTSMLNNSGDHIVLFDGSGKIVDQYEFTKDPGVDKTIGRAPDGAGSFEFLEEATKGEINSGVLPTITPTPSNTPTPTNIPTPTRTPTPTKTLTTKPPTTANQSSSKSASAKTNVGAKKPTINLSNMPTSILGASSAAQKKTKKTEKKKNTVLVKDAAYNPSMQGGIIAGALCLIASGIIMFIKKRRVSS